MRSRPTVHPDCDDALPVRAPLWKPQPLRVTSVCLTRAASSSRINSAGRTETSSQTGVEWRKGWMRVTSLLPPQLQPVPTWHNAIAQQPGLSPLPRNVSQGADVFVAVRAAIRKVPSILSEVLTDFTWNYSTKHEDLFLATDYTYFSSVWQSHRGELWSKYISVK